MRDKVFGILQRVGRSFMLPIAILPVAGLFLGIGGSLTNETMLSTYGLTNLMGPGTPIYSILLVLNDAGNIVFSNLPIIFAVGVAIGMARQEKAVAALSAAIAFFIMNAAIGAMIDITGGVDNLLEGAAANVVGITSLQMGVFGGIIVGIGVAALHNKFYKIELPQVLSFFGGTRFVPIICSIVYLFVGIAMFYIWPPIQAGIYKVGDIVLKSGYAGTWVYGVMERALIPFGLHHVFYLPFWQTAVGGTAEVGGVLIEGAQNIFFAELSVPDIQHFSVEATRFMSGKFPLMIFGLPGAAFAMYRCAKPQKRKVAGGLLLSAALTSMLTGITEPLEFTFLFVAPLLYVIHCIFAGLAYMFMHVFGVGVGLTFSGGLIDLFLFGIMQGNAKTDWFYIVLVGLVYFAVYYFLFSVLIRKFNYKTPGREDDSTETKLYTRSDVNARKQSQHKTASAGNSNDTLSADIVKGLGGIKNISDVDCCATRLRVTVHNGNNINDSILKSTGAAGVIKKGNGVQIIYGPRVTVIKSNLDIYMSSDKNKHTDSNIEIYAPIDGIAMSLDKVEDGVFSEGMLGEGIAIQPMANSGDICKIYSPVDGEISLVYDTKHAIGIVCDKAEILIHIGIDTVKLNGKHFNIRVKKGDKVKKGQLLGSFNVKSIETDGYKTITPIIISNSDSFTEIATFADGTVKNGDKIMTLTMEGK